MQCVFCGTQVANLEFFLKVALCPSCARLAKGLRDRAKSELETMLATLDDAIRVALCDPTVGLELERAESLSSEEVLNYTVALNKHFRKEKTSAQRRSS